MPGVDFGEVKQRVSIRQAAQYLGLPWKGGDQARCACPKCEPDSERKRELVLTDSKGVFYCWKAKAGGDVITLAAHVLDLAPRDAALWLAERAGMVPPKGEQDTQRRGNQDTRRGTVPATSPGAEAASEVRAFQPLPYLDASHAAVEAAGFDPKDAERLGIGFAGKGVLRGLVAVPIRLPTGELVGYIGIDEAKIGGEWHWPETADAANVLKFKKPA